MPASLSEDLGFYMQCQKMCEKMYFVLYSKHAK